MVKRFDAVVLGAGIVGVSTALHLQQRGRRVALIDRRGPGEETSWGNSGVIEASSALPYAFPTLKQLLRIIAGRDTAARMDLRCIGRVLPFVVRLKQHTSPAGRLRTARAARPLLANCVAEHRQLMDRAGAAGFLRETGWAKLYRTQAGFELDAPARTVLRDFDIAFEVMAAGEFRSELEPHINTAFHRAVWFTDTVTVTNPGGLTKSYAASFAAHGGTLLRGDATSLGSIPEGGWRVHADDGTVEAPDVVVAMGPWSMDVLRPLGYRFPLGIKRGYHRHFRPLGGAILNRTVVDVEKGYLIAPMEQGYRITTGAEFTDRDAPASSVQIARVLPFAREMFPLGESSEPQPWMGSRPCFPDSLPIVGRAHNHTGLWLNFGHGHLGLTLGPVTGRLLAEQMSGTLPLCDPSPLRSTRF